MQRNREIRPITVKKKIKNQSIEIGLEITEVMESVGKVFNSYYEYIQGFKKNNEQNEKRN